MRKQSRRDRRLNGAERAAALAAGVILFAMAALMVLEPPNRSIALESCVDASAGCVVEVDAEVGVLTTALVAAGAVLVLVGVLGVRFNKIRVREVEASFEEQTEGLARGKAQDPSDRPRAAVEAVADELDGIVERWGDDGALRTTLPIDEVDPDALTAYRYQVYRAHRDVFISHLLGPPRERGQRYSIALFLTGHKADALDHVTAAKFFFGPSWGSQVFAASRGSDGRLGVVLEAYGSFLALCEVQFDDGERILMDHYCDFAMGSLVDELTA